MKLVYHVTSAEYLPSVMREGLFPHIGPRSVLCESEPAIYVFQEWLAVEQALLGWLGEALEHVPDEDLVVLGIDPSGSAWQRTSAEYELTTTTTIPCQRIVRVLDQFSALSPHHYRWLPRPGRSIESGLPGFSL